VKKHYRKREEIKPRKVERHFFPREEMLKEGNPSKFLGAKKGKWGKFLKKGLSKRNIKKGLINSFKGNFFGKRLLKGPPKILLTLKDLPLFFTPRFPKGG